MPKTRKKINKVFSGSVGSVQKENPGGVASGLNPCQRELAGKPAAGSPKGETIDRREKDCRRQPAGWSIAESTGSERGKTENQRDSASYKGQGLMFGAGSATVAKAKNNRKLKTSSGFTFVELMVALVIGAGVIMVAVMAYGAITQNGPSRRMDNLALGTNSIPLYGTNIAYGTNATLIAVSEAPSYAAAAMAESMRERLLGDIASASAVCCLGRNKANPSGLRVTNLALPTNFDVRGMVTPENFRTNLIEPVQNAFVAYSGAATNSTNLSIYIFGSSGNATNVIVKAIYETDLLTLTNNPPGVYASVRRFVGPVMTDYYHVFYPTPPPGSSQRTTFTPLAVFFDQASNTNNSPFNQASNRPFYFVWWPDPARKFLASSYASESGSTTNARAAYSDLAGATSFFFVIPAFPPL